MRTYSFVKSHFAGEGPVMVKSLLALRKSPWSWWDLCWWNFHVSSGSPCLVRLVLVHLAIHQHWTNGSCKQGTWVSRSNESQDVRNTGTLETILKPKKKKSQSNRFFGGRFEVGIEHFPQLPSSFQPVPASVPPVNHDIPNPSIFHRFS